MFQIVNFCVLIIYCFNLCQSQDEAWSQNEFVTENREELIITKVTSEQLFTINSNVSRWKSLSIGPICYSIGLSEKGLHILEASLNENKTGFAIKNSFYGMENKPSDAVIFHNRQRGKSEAVIVVSFFDKNKISWIKISSENPNEEFWSWTTEYPVQHVNCFKMETRNFLFFVTNKNVGFLYEFDIKNNPLEKWFVQRLSLKLTPNSSAFNNFNDQYFLSIPQADSVLIYKYSNNKFKNFTKIKTPQVTSIINFDIGFKTFFVVNGLNAGIYKFSHNGLSRKRIINSNPEGINFWLPVPIETYRDEVFLLAQRTLDHSTHKAFKVDVVTYNNDKFVEHEDIKCSHFEYTTETLNCLTYENGILGSSYLVIGDTIGLIVPGPNSSFILFMIQTKMKQNPHPREQEILGLVKTKKTIEVILEQQNKNLEEISHLLNPTPVAQDTFEKQKDVIAPQNLAFYLSEVENLGLEIDRLSEKVKNLENKEKKLNYDTIFINGEVKFEDTCIVNEVEVKYINNENATNLLIDIVSKENINKQLKNKTFIELDIDHLKANTANGIDTKNMVFKDEPEIILNGTITFNQFANLNMVNVTTKKINDIQFEDEAVILGKKHEGTLDFNQIKVEENLIAMQINDVDLQKISDGNNSRSKRNLGDVSDDSLFIPHNLTVNFINGINFTEFLHSLCMINKMCVIEGNVIIQEKIHVDDIDVDYLNELKFPKEYVLLNSEPNANIIGKKIFKNTLTAEVIRSRGNINGVDTKNLVTLSTNQNLQNITFQNLELTEQLDVDGKILGEFAGKFLDNPTLQDDNLIWSKVNFKNLEVKGNIIIEKNFNDQKFDTILRNIVYNDEDEATISSLKEFPKGVTVAKELHIKSKSINTADLNKFVTKSSDQTLKINLLNGNVLINNLFVNGTYDGRNIKEVDESLVKLSGDQFISSSLSFNDLVVENLEIDEKLNDIKADEYLYTTENEIDIINENIHFNNLIVENLIIKGNLNGVISGYDLKEIAENYLSVTKNQTIEQQFNINSSTVDSLIFLNTSNKEYIFGETTYSQFIEEMLNTGTLKVKNLHFEESIDVNNINDQPVSNIIPVTIIEMAKNNGNQLIFENDLYLKEIELTNLSSVNWNDYIKQIVFKNQTKSKVVFSSSKNFPNGITVKNLVETKKINNISIENVLTKQGDQIVKGPIEIVGDLSVENVKVKENINDISVEPFLRMLSFSNEGEYYLKSDVVFKRLSYIESLKIKGLVNNKNIEDLFKELVYKNKSIVLKHDIIFTKPVNITGNLAITQNFNNIDFNDIKSKIVLITEDADIDSIVYFSKNVDIKEKMTVDEDLSAKFVGGFNIKDWQEKAVYVNKGLIKGHYTIDFMEINSELTTNFLNDLDMTKIIPLKSNQSIDYLHFKSLKFVKDIPVGKKVNGLFLPEEIQRTLMKNSDQDVMPTTIFQKILVRQNLNTNLLNNKPASKIVTTNTNQNLTARYMFESKITLESDLNVNGLINKVDYKKWKDNTVMLNSNNIQNINSEWKVLDNLTFEMDVYSSNPINDLDLPKIAKETQERKDFKYQFEHGIINDYLGICSTITSFYQQAKSQIYRFKYFEDSQTLSFKNTIKHVFNFEFKRIQYLLINQETCLSDIMVYNGTKFVPLILNIPTGLVEQAVPVINLETMFLVIRGNNLSNCNNILGTNIWKFNGKQLKLKFNMDDQELLQDSLVPSTFYSISQEGVIEYKIKKSEGPIRYRKWEILKDNIAFIPRGLKTGLAMRTGEKIIYLDRSDPINVNDLSLDPISEEVIRGSFKEVNNHYIPGRNEDNIVVLKVGIKSARKNLLAVARHEETVVKGSLDFIEIYENPLTGQLFDKLPTYKPSSLLSMDFDQGETILAFIEDLGTLQIYEYKGIEGFQPRNSIRMKGALSLFQINLDTINEHNSIKTIGIVFKNKIRLLQAVMDGTKIRNDLNCNL